jgi:Na+-transporting NADH:ubiquinone oxidoreductase subunit NqrC
MILFLSITAILLLTGILLLLRYEQNKQAEQIAKINKILRNSRVLNAKGILR